MNCFGGIVVFYLVDIFGFEEELFVEVVFFDGIYVGNGDFVVRIGFEIDYGLVFEYFVVDSIGIDEELFDVGDFVLEFVVKDGNLVIIVSFGGLVEFFGVGNICWE